MNPKNKKQLLLLTIGAWSTLILIIVFWNRIFPPTWNAVFYTHANNGRSPVYHGPFKSQEDCYNEGKKILRSKKVKLYNPESGKNDLEPATFFCGSDCHTDALMGGSVIDEHYCSSKNVPRLNSDNPQINESSFFSLFSKDFSFNL